MARVARFEVDLGLAQQMAAAARATALQDQALISVAVVDAGGNLLCFERMDGAEIAGPVLARDKAYTAVAHRIGTHELTELVGPNGSLAGMYAQDHGRYVAFAGGLPLWDADRVIGGVGVSGGTAEQDLRAAQAALAIYAAEVEQGHG